MFFRQISKIHLEHVYSWGGDIILCKHIAFILNRYGYYPTIILVVLMPMLLKTYMHIPYRSQS